MWIKSLDNNRGLGQNVWVNMNHITHFTIRTLPSPIPSKEKNTIYGVKVYLDAQDKTGVLVYRGTEKKCQQFIKKQLRRQAISQWIGYLVAGGLGAVFAAVLTVVLTHLFLRG